jgi:hypothetical protein
MALGGSAVLFVSMLAPLGSVGTTATAAPSSQFPDVAPDTTSFQALWDRTDSLVASQQVTDRSWYWGPAAIWTTREQYVDDPQGTGTRLVQYWDKSRMEINDPNGDKRNPFYITNGLLTVELISGNMQTGNNTFVTRKPANIPIAGDTNDPNAPTYASFASHSNAGVDHPDPDKTGQLATSTIARDGTVGNDPSKADVPNIKYVYYDDVTKHNVPEAMWNFLNQEGQVNDGGQVVSEQINNPWFYATGRPISDPYWATIMIAGTPAVTLVQAFERRVLTYTPSNPEAFQVEMGNIGLHYKDWRYISSGRVNGTTATYPLSGPHPGYGFNVQLFYTDKDKVLAKVKEAGFSYARQQVAWMDEQGQNLYFAWGELDRVVDAANRNGVKLILSIAKSPDWASPSSHGGMPDNPLDFGNFMYQMALHYKGKVAAYEIWNETNLKGESGGAINAGQYVELLKYGYSGVKFADPDAVVIFGAPTPTEVNDPNVAIDDVLYLQQAYDYAGGLVKNYYDVMGSHPGSNNNSPDQLWPDNPGTGHCPPIYASQEGTCWRNKASFYFRRIEQQHAVMASNGEGNKQMWLTEFGWSTYNTAPGYEYGQLISPELQAQYLVRAYQKGKTDYPWMGVMSVWNLNFSTLGLPPSDEKVPWSVLNPDFSARPAFTALQGMTK